MKKRLTITIAVAALAAATSLAAAGYYQRQRAQATAADALPAYEILNNVRALGFRPTTQALRRGPYYVMHAIDPRGMEVRVVADAQLGDIVSVAPIVAPRISAGPRIIHVPQPGERADRSTDTDDDEAAATDENGDDDIAPLPPRRQPAQRRIEAPPSRASAEPLPRPKPAPRPVGPPRNVLSAPPPPAGTSLTPIYPTPRFDTKNEPAEKFAPPDESLAKMPPPPGYTPPGSRSEQD